MRRLFVSRVNEVEENLKQIFDEQEEQRQREVDLLQETYEEIYALKRENAELIKENDLVWGTITNLKRILGRI